MNFVAFRILYLTFGICFEKLLPFERSKLSVAVAARATQYFCLRFPFQLFSEQCI
jgi:hypothetical protein